MTADEKKKYNQWYYRQHKNYWADYYNVGKKVGRPMSRQKNVSAGNGQGVTTRPTGRAYYGDAYNSSMHNWSNLVSQVGTPEQSQAYNQSLFGESGQAQLYQRPKARKKKVTSGTGVGTVRKDESAGPSVRPNRRNSMYDSPIGPQKSTLTGKQKAKKLLESFSNNWKSGSVDVKNAGKQFVSDWKSGATQLKKLFQKKPVTVTNTWSATAGGQNFTGSSTTVLRNKRRK